MTVEPITRQTVIEMIDKLPTEKLPEVAQFVEFLRFKSDQDMEHPDSEDGLLKIINRRFPAADQQRVDILRAKNEDAQLTSAEHIELLAYVERAEREDVERAEAMIALARLRGIPLSAIINQFKTAPDAI